MNKKDEDDCCYKSWISIVNKTAWNRKYTDWLVLKGMNFLWIFESSLRHNDDDDETKTPHQQEDITY